MARLLILVLAAGVAALAQAPDLRELRNRPDGGMRDVVERFTADRENLLRFHDERLSEKRRERLREFYSAWQSGLDRIDFDALGVDGRVDYLLLENRIGYLLRQLEIDQRRAEEMEPALPFAAEIVGLHDARRQREPVVPKEAAARIDRLNKQVRDLTRSLADKDAPEAAKPIRELPAPVVLRSVRTITDLEQTLGSWYEFYAGYDPLFTWWVEKPYEELAESLEAYREALRGDVLGLDPEDEDTIVGDPAGREALMVDLAAELIPYTPEELIAIGRKEFAWCISELKNASRELGYGDDWKKALEHVKDLHVEPGEQPALVRKLAFEAVDFLQTHDLVTVPPMAKETWRMRMMSPERQKINPFFLGGETVTISYPTDDMTHEQKLMSMRGNNIHFSRAVVHHELIPGHWLQFFMTTRHHRYRREFRTPFWVEGWALWWELLLWDLDFPRSPEDRIGMLFWRAHRGARIVFSLGFHLGQMTPEECVDFLVEEAGHERENAAAEVRRSFAGAYPPLYQIAYLIGGLQFRALHEELVESGRMTAKEFHDAILEGGMMPVDMVRASLTGQRLQRDYQTSWKFYEGQ